MYLIDHVCIYRYLQSLHLPTSEEERNVLRAGNMTLSEYLSNLAAMETA